MYTMIYIAVRAGGKSSEQPSATLAEFQIADAAARPE